MEPAGVGVGISVGAVATSLVCVMVLITIKIVFKLSKRNKGQSVLSMDELVSLVLCYCRSVHRDSREGCDYGKERGV